MREDAVLIVQDDLLDALYPGEINDLKDFARFVLDFPANTTMQRAWCRGILERASGA